MAASKGAKEGASLIRVPKKAKNPHWLAELAGHSKWHHVWWVATYTHPYVA